MVRRPEILAALADAALPGLRPQAVSGTPVRSTDRFESALVHAADGSAWTVRVSLSPASGAALDAADDLLKLLAKRVPFAVPRTEGRLQLPDATVVTVHRALQGEPTRWRDLTAGSALARSVGRSLAALHDVDPRVVEEAGLPTYDADAYRARRLATLDRAAATGLVPSGLLDRWERALEEVSLWRFATCVTHGPLEGADVLVMEEVSAITGWERAGVADPADDFAAIQVLAPPEAFDTVLETYAGARREAPDAHLERRVRLSSELQRITALLEAVSSGDHDLVDRRAAALRRLNEQTIDDNSLMPSTARRRPALVDPMEDVEPVDPDQIEAVEVSDADDDAETVEIPTESDQPGSTPSSKGAEDSPEDQDSPTAQGGDSSLGGPSDPTGDDSSSGEPTDSTGEGPAGKTAT